VVLRRRLPAEALDTLGRAFDAAVDRLAHAWKDAGLVDDVADGLGYDARFAALRAQHDDPLPGAWRKVLVTPEVYGMWRRPELLGALRSIVGDEVYAHGIWNGRPRLPGDHAAQVLWHQDAHYYRRWQPGDGQLVSCWMPLVSVDAGSSCLEFVAGSHRGGLVERLRAPTGLFTVADEAIDAERVVTAEMEPGDVVLFTDTTLHQSTRNDSDHIRWSLDIRFAEATPALVAKAGRGYRCHSAERPDLVESFDTWAARYRYDPSDLVDELENFAGADPDDMRRMMAKVPARMDVY
jgi:hypothetical protein